MNRKHARIVLASALIAGLAAAAIGYEGHWKEIYGPEPNEAELWEQQERAFSHVLWTKKSGYYYMYDEEALVYKNDFDNDPVWEKL